MADYYNNTTNGCMEWDDVIENDGQEFVLLPEGDYQFEVVDFERGRFPGGPKIPACNKATVTLQKHPLTRILKSLSLAGA